MLGPFTVEVLGLFGLSRVATHSVCCDVNARGHSQRLVGHRGEDASGGERLLALRPWVICEPRTFFHSQPQTRCVDYTTPNVALFFKRNFVKFLFF